MITTEELGRRLRAVRERSGYTQEEVAAAVGLDATAVAKIEHGRRGVGAIELKDMARLFGITVDTLLEDASSRVEVQLRVAMRAGEAESTKADAMMRRLQHIIADDRWLREREPKGAPDVTWSPIKMPMHNAGATGHQRGYDTAAVFRDRYRLGGSPIADMAVLADEVGILVSRLPLGEHNAPDGCAALDPQDATAYVLINSDKPRARRRFTIAHEIAHLALGHLASGDMALDESVTASLPKEKETEANAFAAGLLMPEDGIKGAIDRLSARLGSTASPLEWTVWLAASFGVSEEAVAYRVLNLGLDRLSGVDMVEAIKEAKGNPALLRLARVRVGLTPVMADAERGITEVGPAMRARVAQALEQGLISIEGAANMLHVSVQEAYKWVVESGIQSVAAGDNA